LPEVLSRLLQVGQIEWIGLLDRGVGGSLAPTPVSQEPGGFKPVPVAPGLVAGDVPPELSQRILTVMARVYWALWQETRLQHYRDGWSRIGETRESRIRRLS
jgi:hypothetical protein